MNEQVVKELWVDGQFVGIIRAVEMTRESVEEPSSGIYRQFKPGPVVRVCVTLVKGA